MRTIGHYLPVEVAIQFQYLRCPPNQLNVSFSAINPTGILALPCHKRNHADQERASGLAI